MALTKMQQAVLNAQKTAKELTQIKKDKALAKGLQRSFISYWGMETIQVYADKDGKTFVWDFESQEFMGFALHSAVRGVLKWAESSEESIDLRDIENNI